MCHFCKTTDYLLCINCYDELYSNIKNSSEEDSFFKDFIMKDDNNKKEENNMNNNNNSEDKLYKKIHEHPLLFLYNFNSKKKTNLIKNIYDKYKEEIMNDTNKKANKSEIKICAICSNYLFEDAKNINIMLSHFKIKKEYSPYEKQFEEVYICNQCFEKNEYQNVISKEENDNNFIILSMIDE